MYIIDALWISKSSFKDMYKCFGRTCTNVLGKSIFEDIDQKELGTCTKTFNRQDHDKTAVEAKM